MLASEKLREGLAQQSELIDGRNGLSLELRSAISRSVCLTSYALLEEFLASKAEEWASQFRILGSIGSDASRAQLAPAIRTASILSHHVNARSDEASQIALIQSVGRSFISVGSTSFTLPPVALLWQGSNIQAADLERILSLLSGATGKDVWASLTTTWQRLSPSPTNGGFRQFFELFAGYRHHAAHAPIMKVSELEAAGVPRGVRLMAACIDYVGSRSVRLRNQGVKPDSLKWGKLAMRRVVERPGGATWAEYGPDSKRALKVHSSMPDAVHSSRLKSSADNEIVVVFDAKGDFIDWHYG